MSIIDLLAQMSWQELLVSGFFIAGLTVLAAYLIIYILKKVGLIRIGAFQIGSSTDLMDLLHKHASMIHKIRDIQMNILPQQLRYAEAKSIESRGLLQKTFLSLVEDKCKEDDCYTETSDYRTYKLCLRVLHDELRIYYNDMFIQNHLAEKTEEEFRDYCELCAAQILQIGTDILNDLYKGDTISRASIFNANKDIVDVLKDHIMDTIIYARHVAMKASDEVAFVEKQFDVYFKDVYGLRR